MSEEIDPFFDFLKAYWRDGHERDTVVPQAQTLTPALRVQVKQQLALPQEGSWQSCEQVWQTVVNYGPTSFHPKFLNQLYGPLHPASWCGELLAATHNNSMATHEVAPIASLMEEILMERLCELVGYEAATAEGILVPGGSFANLVGLLLARNHHFPQSAQEGLTQQPICCFVSEQAHYSLTRAANVLGIGRKNVIAVATDDQGRMLPDDLIRQIQDAKGTPFAVVATAGTTVTGSIDPIGELAQICQRFGLWLHVDAAFGGPLLFAPQMRPRLAGIELADSITWDAHKLLAVPLTCSAILVKRRGDLQNYCGGDEATYLFHQTELAERPDLGLKSLQCGRREDSLKLFSLWHALGETGLQARLERLVAVAQKIEALVREHGDFEVVLPRQSLMVCFRYLPEHLKTADLEQVNQVNLAIRQRLIDQGEYYVNYSYWRGQMIFRLVAIHDQWEAANYPRLLNLMANKQT